MVSKFREVYKAVAFVCSGLKENCNDGAYAEISLFPRGRDEREQRSMVDIAHLAAALDHFSKRFPSANAVTKTEDKARPRGMIQCRCDREIRKHCPNQCRHHVDRPAICVIVFSDNRAPSLDETKSALDLMLNEIHEYQKEYIKDHPSEYRHQSSRSSRSSRSHP